ncbi:MAG: hypothetical protein HF300_12570 [Ignavibacteria bacterium]|jgi:photosystem II stability/assembly factor-like uncharacterized protein|nr:hypothetical protein [Ignavibacteria bacterium]
MKTAKFIVLLFFISQSLLAQSLPKRFMLNGTDEESADSPAGNDIGDIIALGDTVVISTGAGVSRSSDRGESWTNFLNLSPSDNRAISALAYHNGVIWAAFQTEVEQLGEMQPAGAGLMYSTDRGASWTSIPQPVDSKTDTLINYGKNILEIVPIHTKVNNISYDIAVTDNTVWIASWAGGLRKSSDMGKTWQRVVLPTDSLDRISPEDTLNFTVKSQDLNELVFSIAAVDSLTLYAGSAGGINKTTDGGLSWRKFNHINQTKPISGNWVTSLNYNQLTKTLYAASWRAEGNSEFYALSFTSDGGESWTTALDGEKVLAIGFMGEDVIAATENGAYRSGNMGKTWILPGRITDSRSKLSLKTNVFYSAASEGNDIWLGTGSGLVRLKENGSMWSGDWRIYLASQALRTESETYAFPNPFSPDVETVGIKYSTGAKASGVTIRIFDFGMNLVRTVIRNAERGSTHEGTAIDFWDGKDERGSIVPNGVYFYRIDIDGGQPLFGKIMVVM